MGNHCKFNYRHSPLEGSNDETNKITYQNKLYNFHDRFQKKKSNLKFTSVNCTTTNISLQHCIFGTHIYSSNESTTLQINRFYCHIIYWQYSARSIVAGIGLISVPNSCSMRYKLNLSSKVIRFTAKPRCPNLPDRPIRCK